MCKGEVEAQYNSRRVPLSAGQSITKGNLQTKPETKLTGTNSMSAPAITGQAPIILGPLPTIFTPPPACATAVGFIDSGPLGLGKLIGGPSISNIAFLGQTCSRGKAIDATSCWPPVASGVSAKSASLEGWGFYSPGVHCPAGYATACSATGGGGKAGWDMQFQLQDGETAVGCCPRCVSMLSYAALDSS